MSNSHTRGALRRRSAPRLSGQHSSGGLGWPKSFYARAAATKDLKLEKIEATDHNAFYALKMKDGSIYTIVVTENETSGFTPQERAGHDPDGIFNYYRNKVAAPA